MVRIVIQLKYDIINDQSNNHADRSHQSNGSIADGETRAKKVSDAPSDDFEIINKDDTTTSDDYEIIKERTLSDEFENVMRSSVTSDEFETTKDSVTSTDYEMAKDRRTTSEEYEFAKESMTSDELDYPHDADDDDDEVDDEVFGASFGSFGMARRSFSISSDRYSIRRVSTFSMTLLKLLGVCVQMQSVSQLYFFPLFGASYFLV